MSAQYVLLYELHTGLAVSYHTKSMPSKDGNRLHVCRCQAITFAKLLPFFSHDSYPQLETLEKELLEERDVNERLIQQIRELEQDNDDLERAKRVLAASLEEFETRLESISYALVMAHTTK